jgi:hypothetical protein
MKTEDLVALLSTNVEPVERSSVMRPLCLAVGAGAVVALGIAVFGLGVRSDFATSRALIFLAVKLSFAIGTVGLSIVYLARLARPGGELKISLFLIFAPFLLIVLLAAISLGSAPRAHWDSMIVADEWLECLLSIPIIAVVPFAATIWAVRRGAPTNLGRAGACAGLLAGGLSAIGYALHCTGDSLPFIAVWYGGTIVLCTLAGAALGPWLLRW